MKLRYKTWVLLLGILVALFSLFYTTKETHAFNMFGQIDIQITTNELLVFRSNIE